MVEKLEGLRGYSQKFGFDVGMLVLRVSLGAFMIYGHGWPKVSRWETLSQSFADPFGIGPAPSLALAIFAEIACSLAIILGLFTRLASIPLLITMLVAAFIAHAGDPFRQKELALAYAAVLQLIILAGPGRLSLDHLLWKKVRGAAPAKGTSSSSASDSLRAAA